jgi:hypothetical protein
LAWYRDDATFTGKFAGESTWECHPNGDEIMQVDGATTLQVMTADGPQSFARKAGVVPILPEFGTTSRRGRGELDDRYTSAHPAPHGCHRGSSDPRMTAAGYLGAREQGEAS